eukprot:scaffold420_cov404-Prasinococcus_capsulatus_cf.AAC.13
MPEQHKTPQAEQDEPRAGSRWTGRAVHLSRHSQEPKILEHRCKGQVQQVAPANVAVSLSYCSVELAYILAFHCRPSLRQLLV